MNIPTWNAGTKPPAKQKVALPSMKCIAPMKMPSANKPLTPMPVAYQGA